MRCRFLNVFVVLMALGSSASTSAEEWSKARIATEGAYPPWNSIDRSGQLVGFEIDLARDLCWRMAVECEIVAQDWEGIIPALQAGKYDAIMAAMSITDQRKKVIQFTDSYAATPARFAVRNDSELADHQSGIDRIDLREISAVEQAEIQNLKKMLQGKTIGVQVATTHANFLLEYMGGSVEVRQYDTQENLDLDLQAGRIDAALAEMNYWGQLAQENEGKGFAQIGPAMTGGPFGKGVGVGLRKEDHELLAIFNEAIAEAREEGVIAELSEKWFGFDAST